VKVKTSQIRVTFPSSTGHFTVDLVKYLQAYGTIVEWFSYALLAGVHGQQKRLNYPLFG